MNLSETNLKLIFGYKLKQFRQKAQLSLKELSQKTSLSLSYISEIEQGKKYPKPEKIIMLCKALDRPFDELISLQLEDEQSHLSQLLNSPILNEFPWEQFGISIREIVRLVSESDSKAGALIQTLHEVGTNYDMHVEHFLFATLRSFQIMHLNYFEDVEEAAEDFNLQYSKQLKTEDIGDLLESILVDDYNYAIDYNKLHKIKDLHDVRSVWINANPKKLLINRNLQTSQKNFILAKEIGYLRMAVKERPVASSYIEPESFEQIYNNFKASYFAGAIMIEKKALIKDLKKLFNQSKWNGKVFADILKKYNATPEMFLYRLSEILPKFFNFNKFHYMRFHYDQETDSYNLTKSLNTSDVFMPRGDDQTEHHCRRWSAIRSIKNSNYSKDADEDILKRIFVQRSRFIDSNREFFVISVAYFSSTGNRKSSITLGILIDDEFKERVHYWNDSNVLKVDVHETCERCPLNEQQCSERVAPPSILLKTKWQNKQKKSLNSLIQDLS